MATSKPATVINVEEQLLHKVTEAQSAVETADTDESKATAITAYSEATATLAAYYAERQSDDIRHIARTKVRTFKIALSPIVNAWADSQIGLFETFGSLTYRGIESITMLHKTGQIRKWDENTAATVKYALTEAFKRSGVDVATSNASAKIGDVLITIQKTRQTGEELPVPTVRVRTAQ